MGNEDMKKGEERQAGILGTRIFLVRHGETDWNRTRRFQGRIDISMNQEGKRQVRALALALRDEPLAAIYSSPLVRAMETAGLIKAFHPSTTIFEEEGLVEMDIGDFDGMEAQVWAAQYPDFRKAWQQTPAIVRMPGGETLQEVQTRAIHTLERVIRLHPPDSTLLLCSHNFVNRTILCHALGIPLERFRELKQDAAALNVLRKYEGNLRAEVVNDLSHLKKYEGLS
jgi:broad specificity phosphatase PhoE